MSSGCWVPPPLTLAASTQGVNSSLTLSLPFHRGLTKLPVSSHRALACLKMLCCPPDVHFLCFHARI